MGFPGGAVIKNPPANAGDVRDVASIPGSGRFPGRGIGNPLQHSCLGNPLDRGAWWATVHTATKSQPDWTHTTGHQQSNEASGWILRFSKTQVRARVLAYRRRWRVLTERQKTGEKKEHVRVTSSPKCLLDLNLLIALHLLEELAAYNLAQVYHRFPNSQRFLPALLH